jgi:hypothetical protein
MTRRSTILILFAAVVAVAAGTATRTLAGAGASGSGAPSSLSLPFFYDLYTFRGEGGSSRVVAAFAIPAGRLRRESWKSGIRYRFDVSLVVADRARKAVYRTDDSVFISLPDRLEDEHLLHTHLEVEAPPSPTSVQRVILSDATTPGFGQLYRGPFPVPDYSGDELMLSDVALGLPDAAAGWRRGEFTLALLPTNQFPGNTFDVYYEIYNLPAGHQYATELAIERRSRGGGEVGTSVQTRFSGESSATEDGVLAELRRVEVSLDPGPYRLTVRVVDLDTGRTATRSREFRVRGWEGGTMMVPALPWRGGRETQR